MAFIDETTSNEIPTKRSINQKIFKEIGENVCFDTCNHMDWISGQTAKFILERELSGANRPSTTKSSNQFHNYTNCRTIFDSQTCENLGKRE